MSKEVMKMALDALEYCDGYNGHIDVSEAIEALRAALSQQNSPSNISSNSEPVAWMYRVNNNFEQLSFIEPPDDAYDDGSLIPLYTAPPQRKPLTDKQVDSLWQTTDTGDAELDGRSFARAIEAAHGIGEES